MACRPYQQIPCQLFNYVPIPATKVSLPFLECVKCASGSGSLPLLFHKNTFPPDACMVQSLTSFRSLLTYHLPERSSPTTPSKTTPLNHLISSLPCLFLCNIGYFLTYIFVYLASPKRMAAPWESGFCLFGLILYIQHLEWCLAPSASRWENSARRFKL